MKKITILILVAVMLAACGGEVKKPRGALDRNPVVKSGTLDSIDEESFPTQKQIELAMKESDTDGVFPELFEVKQKPLDDKFTKSLESCREIKPKLNDFVGKLLQESVQCEHIQLKSGLVLKDVSAIECVVADSHGRVVEDGDGQVLFRNRALQSFPKWSSSIFFNQVFSDDGNRFAYVDAASDNGYELGIFDLTTLKTQIFVKKRPEIGCALFNTSCRLTGNTLTCFEGNKILKFDTDTEWMLENYYLNLNPPNSLTNLCTDYIPYNIYDPDSKRCYVITGIHVAINDGHYADKIYIARIDENMYSTVIYKANTRPYSTAYGSADVSKDFIVFTSPSFQQDACLVAIDKKDGSTFQIKMQGYNSDENALEKLVGKNMVYSNKIIDLKSRKITFYEPDFKITPFFDENFYMFGKDMLVAVSFGTLKPVWKMQLEKGSRIGKSLDGKQIIVNADKKVLFIDPKNPEQIMMFSNSDYFENTRGNNRYSEGIMYDPDSGKVYTGFGQCFGKRQPDKLYINPLNYELNYGMDLPPDKTAKSTLVWTGSEPAEAVLIQTVDGKEEKQTLTLKPWQKIDVDITLYGKAQLVFKDKTYTFNFRTHGHGD